MIAEPGSARITVVVPAFNEARSIRDVVDGLLRAGLRVVVVDDGSADDTAARLAGSGAKVLRHRVNRGQGAALQTGIRFAVREGADAIVTFDADGQHDPADVAALAAPVLAGECDVALGSRFLGEAAPAIPPLRKLTLKAGLLFTRVVTPLRLTDVHNGLRAFSPAAARALRITMDGMAHASEILDEVRRHRWRYREVPVTVRYSTYSLEKGQSGWNAFRIAFRVLVEKLR